jgi:outer membrane protein
MKKIILILISLVFFIPKVFAVTLSEALTQAYKNNPELNAERENIKVSEEDLNISKGDYLPTLTLSGSKSQEKTHQLTNQTGGDASVTDVDPQTTSITIEQTLIDFGRDAENEKNKIGINLAKAKLLKKEQDILYKAIEAYTGLILANEKFEINQENVNLLERQVETDSIRLERGQVTLSDVAQSESSLAEAQARFIQAQNEVLTSKLNYENIIGSLSNSKSLVKNSTLNFIIPKNLNSAIDLSKKNNPDLTIAKLEYEQSEKDTIIAKSDLSPTAKLSFEKTYSEDLNSTYDEKEKDILKATVSWPFYSGGKNRATYKKNKNLQTRKRLLLDNTTKTNETNVASAWSNFQSSKSLLNSVELQVRAAEIANEGITAEYQSGLGRTTLEVIQSNSFLLNAQISLANSERNYLLSQFNLLKSIGLLNSDYLKIK